MPLAPELRAVMARDMQSNRKFDGDTDIPDECRKFDQLSRMETVEMPPVDGWPYKLYIFHAKNKTPNCPVHINVHGGGWLLGHMLNDTLWSSWLADQIKGVVVDVDYTTTEYASHPVALHQGMDAARYTFAHCQEWGGDPKRVSMGGYSAGGGLTMGVAVAAGMSGEKLPFCLLVDGYAPHDIRYDENAKEIPEFWKTQEHRTAGFGVLLSDDNPELLSDPSICFVEAPDSVLAALPPTLVLAAASDPFRHQNLEQATKLASAGVEVTVKVYPDTVHGFIPHFMPHWREAGDLIVRGILHSGI